MENEEDYSDNCILHNKDTCLRHFRVIANGILVNEISPSLAHARRIAANMIMRGGEAVIFESVEAWFDEGASLTKQEIKVWP